MSFPGNPSSIGNKYHIIPPYRKTIIRESANKPIIARNNSFKKNKTCQHIYNTTRPYMIRFPSNNPCQIPVAMYPTNNTFQETRL